MSEPAQVEKDSVQQARAIQIVVEVDEDRNVKVYSNYTPVNVEVVKYDEIDAIADLVSKAKEVSIKAPHEVYTD